MGIVVDEVFQIKKMSPANPDHTKSKDHDDIYNKSNRDISDGVGD